MTSVCTGAFLLARAGLLDGRRATTHWASCPDLAERYPAVTVEPDPIFVRDGNVATSAGVTAGMDLALALVEEDLGRDVALEAARWLVLFLKRPGGQAQFSAQLAAQTADRAPLRELQAWIPDHLDEDLSVPALASRAAMSERNFARAFRRETGMTPAAYVEAARVESARDRARDGRPARGERRPPGGLRDRRDDATGVQTAGRREPRRLPRAVSPPRRPNDRRSGRMRIAIPLYDRFTALDAVGPLRGALAPARRERDLAGSRARAWSGRTTRCSASRPTPRSRTCPTPRS